MFEYNLLANYLAIDYNRFDIRGNSMKINELYKCSERDSSIEYQLNNIAILCSFANKGIGDTDMYIITNGHKRLIKYKNNSKSHPNQA